MTIRGLTREEAFGIATVDALTYGWERRIYVSDNGWHVVSTISGMPLDWRLYAIVECSGKIVQTRLA